MFFLGYVGLQCAARYWLQGNGQIKTINEAQLVVRNSRIIRPIFIVFMLWIIITGSMKSQPWHVASAIMSLLWQYMFCILIRDREPKDFFEQRKLAGSEA